MIKYNMVTLKILQKILSKNLYTIHKYYENKCTYI